MNFLFDNNMPPGQWVAGIASISHARFGENQIGQIVHLAEKFKPRRRLRFHGMRQASFSRSSVETSQTGAGVKVGPQVVCLLSGSSHASEQAAPAVMGLMQSIQLNGLARTPTSKMSRSA